MTLKSDSFTRRQLRAPAQNGTALIVPPLRHAEQLLAENSARIRDYQYDMQGRSFTRLIADAHRNLIRQAVDYTSAYRDVAGLPDVTKDVPVLLSGHQPQFFHPGVWFKNLALDRLGKSLGVPAIHLLTDNDTVRNTGIRVPTGSVNRPRLDQVLLDRPTIEVPYEERDVADRQLLTSFDQRIRDTISPLVSDPLITQMWKPISEICASNTNLGQCIAQSRHRWENGLSLNTLEVPLSRICQAEPFHWVVAHLLAQLPRFWEIHNSSLLEYRREYGVRSRTHPVPELITVDHWLEAPFWVWTRDNPQRRRLFVRRRDDEIQLTDQASLRLNLALSDDSDAARAVEQLAALEQCGTKIRPRAVITTMYARLMLSDLFLHGIGGAKYDELTDLIIRRFFQLEPPEFLTLTATVMLPIERPRIGSESLQEIDHQLRQLVYHPERHLNDRCQTDPKVASLVKKKRRWIETQLPRGQRRERHRQISRINEELQLCVAKKRDWLLERRRQTASELPIAAILASREYSLCLFPQETLFPLLLELLAGDA